MRDAALAGTIERAGGVVAIAQRLGITKQAVSSWDRVPAERAHAIAAAFNIPLHELRPDLWPAPSEPARETGH